MQALKRTIMPRSIYDNTLRNNFEFSFSEEEMAYRSPYRIKNSCEIAPSTSTLFYFVIFRRLLTLVVCGANALFLVGLLFFEVEKISTGNAVSSVMLLLFLFWLIANELSWKLARDIGGIVPVMFKGKEQLFDSGSIDFRLEKIQSQTAIYEVSQILQSYNQFVEQTNKMIATTKKNQSRRCNRSTSRTSVPRYSLTTH